MLGNAIAGFTSIRGRSHTFDVRADGYARGEAIDALVCRRAGEVVASVEGSAVRQDGRSASLTAPKRARAAWRAEGSAHRCTRAGWWRGHAGGAWYGHRAR